jgi:sugar/nucleoside kinase (ribokinase family)
MEGYLVSSPTAKSTALKAKQIAEKAGVKISLSLSDANMVDYFKDGLLEIIGDGLDFIFSNEIESLKMAETGDLNTAIDYLKTISKGFAITRGPKGSLIFDGQEIIEIEPTKVKAVDTVGAGDMYAGAFLYGITNNLSFADSGKLASAASAYLVTSFGPRLTTEELKSILATIKS